VVGNRIFDNGHEACNWVDFDSEQLLEDLVRQLAATGLERIALVWPSVTAETHNGIQRLWKKSIRAHGLHLYEQFQPNLYSRKHFMAYAEYLYSSPERPQAVVCWSHYADELAKFWAERNWRPVIISQTRAESSNVLSIDIPYRDLAEAIRQVLEELLSGKPVAGIHKLIRHEISLQPRLEQMMKSIQSGEYKS
jgi:DNA-binding LacI/PurR family transcriptional regulator